MKFRKFPLKEILLKPIKRLEWFSEKRFSKVSFSNVCFSRPSPEGYCQVVSGRGCDRLVSEQGYVPASMILSLGYSDTGLTGWYQIGDMILGIFPHTSALLS